MEKNSNFTDLKVRDISFRLATFNRALKLCARMNYEPENLDFIDGIQDGEVFYDLGACEGRFSIYAGKKGITTLSFEPETMNFQTLQKNIEENQLSDKISVYNLALGKVKRNGVINIGQPWAGGHQKIVQHDVIRSDLLDINFKKQQQINIMDLDSFIEYEDVPFPDYVKIDIDGSELPFLDGAEKTLGNKQIKGLLFELNENDASFHIILARLENFGYSVEKSYPIPNESTLFNFLFLRR